VHADKLLAGYFCKAARFCSSARSIDNRSVGNLSERNLMIVADFVRGSLLISRYEC
jgi:hypothetical protein